MSELKAHKPRRRRGFRLRHKLGASLVIAALLPVLVASYVAFSVVLRGLNNGLETETRRQLSVGLNLMLARIEALGNEAARLAASAEIEDTIGRGVLASSSAINGIRGKVTTSLIQLTDAEGNLLASNGVVKWPTRFEGIAITPNDPLIRSGLELDREVTVAVLGRGLVVRAVAPVLDQSFRLRGLVILSMPMDGAFVDELKASLGSDVLVFTGTEAAYPAQATFVDALGRRVRNITVDPLTVSKAGAGALILGSALVESGEFSLGYAPIYSAGREVVGVFAVAVDRSSVASARQTAFKSLGFGAAGAFLFALGLAGLLSRRIAHPLSRLHQGATAIARGDLDHEILVEEGDELGDLAAAFANMTTALKVNQRRLAARMREIVALHDAGRAVSSVIDLEQVLRKIVDSVARVLHVRVCAIWVVDEPGDSDSQTQRMTLGAARAKRGDMRMISRGDEVAAMVEPLVTVARQVASTRATLRIDDVSTDKTWNAAAIASGVSGSLVATPLERKGVVVGVIVIGRTDEAQAFSEADSNLLATFADQAAAAVENASLYAAVRAFNEELEAKVRLRTTELTAINSELGLTITELRETQAQLILSERLAGLGQLVSGVAHEINSPSAAIRGTIDALSGTVDRLATAAAALYRGKLSLDDELNLASLVAVLSDRKRTPQRISPALKRREARSLSARLIEAQLSDEDALMVGRTLVELSFERAELERALELIVTVPSRGPLVARYLREQMYLHRGVATIDAAITRIQRIVGGLKTYSHLDQEADRVEADLHEGIESTLVLLAHEISHGITVIRKYGEIPRVWVLVDELNQVWTNLIYNAVQAMNAKGTIEIETTVDADGQFVCVSFTDDGPGVPEEIKKQIFQPFFTTKERGEGTGLGLGIAQKIIEKHKGQIRLESRPGRTRFSVQIPIALPVSPTDELRANSAEGAPKPHPQEETADAG